MDTGLSSEDQGSKVSGCPTKRQQKRLSYCRPIVAVIGGVNPVQGRVMGHDGAFQSRGENPALSKARKLAKAGVTICEHPSHVGEAMKQLLSSSRGLGAVCF